MMDAKPRRVKSAYLFRNGMVAAFDDSGQQIPELQGEKADVFRPLMDRADADTEFFGFDGNQREWRREDGDGQG